jgi:predicted dehydrogenase
MQSKLTVSIIGAGNIAGGFDEKKLDKDSGIFSHAGAYKKDGRFILKNIFDVDSVRAKEFQKYWEVENIVDNGENILNNYQDIISICSPDKFHFQTIKDILVNNSCKTIFVEKPIGLNLQEVEEIYELSKQSNINIMINFQRHFDKNYDDINEIKSDVLTVNCCYIKGLNHIGITMIDTLIMLFGYPKSVYSYSRVYNNEVKDFTYEFILFYDTFNITIKSIDEEKEYNYHIFDIDIFTKDKRIVFTDNGNTMIDYNLSNYAYSGVKVLTNEPKISKTNYSASMLKSIEYLYDITKKNKKHTLNTPMISYNNHILLDKIIESFKLKQEIKLEEKLWKK